MLYYLMLFFMIVSMLFVLPILIPLLNRERSGRDIISYTYTRKTYIMTKGENQFFQILTKILQNKYYIFPQIHLTSLLEHKITGQGWRGAKSSIDRLSVDYVICDKKYLSPILAIELDDSTHNRADRIERDRRVENILEQAKLPLVRIKYTDRFKEEEIKAKLSQYLTKKY